jgi:hypothetical protein
VHGHLRFKTLTGQRPEALAANDDQLGSMTQAVDAGGGQEWIAE